LVLARSKVEAERAEAGEDVDAPEGSDDHEDVVRARESFGTLPERGGRLLVY
jgi:hypothetical protein